MNKITSLLIMILLYQSGEAKTIVIDQSSPDFTVNRRSLHAKDKQCEVVNCLSKDLISYGSEMVRPLLFFTVFDYSGLVPLADKPANGTTLKEYIDSVVAPRLALDMFLRLASLEPVKSDQPTYIIDTLILFDGHTYNLVKGKVTVLDIFNVTSFKQESILQSNSTLLNTGGRLAKVYAWTKDSIPTVEANGSLDGKIFLVRKQNGLYSFVQYPFTCVDCNFSFSRVYVYKKEYGMVAFRSKYIWRSVTSPPDAIYTITELNESDEYYYFH